METFFSFYTNLEEATIPCFPRKFLNLDYMNEFYKPLKSNIKVYVHKHVYMCTFLERERDHNFDQSCSRS